MKPLVLVFGLLFIAGTLKSQDSIDVKVGRQFLGLDISPITSTLLNNRPAEFYAQYKIAGRNPCLRYRLNYQMQWKESNGLQLIPAGSYNYYSTEYAYQVLVSGYVRTNTLGVGIEKVIPREHFAFIIGGDVVLGSVNEFIQEQINYSNFQNDSARNQYFSDHPAASHTAMRSRYVGIAPTAGIELEVGERLSFQASLRSILGVYSSQGPVSNALTANHYEPLDKVNFNFTGVNLILFYRF